MLSKEEHQLNGGKVTVKGLVVVSTIQEEKIRHLTLLIAGNKWVLKENVTMRKEHEKKTNKADKDQLNTVIGGC